MKVKSPGVIVPATFQIIPLSSTNTDGIDTENEPKLIFPDALQTARELKSQGKAFRVFFDGDTLEDQRLAFRELGAVE
jgi:hypothetical protein